MNCLAATLPPLISHIRRMLVSAILVAAALPLTAQAPEAQTATLPGHIIRALSNATLLPHSAQMDEDPIKLTVVLNLSDPEGAKSLQGDVSNPNSPNFGKTLAASEYTARFEPTQEAYDAVLAYLAQNGFSLSMGSENRRTLTVLGTRAQAQKAFHVTVDDYQLGDRTFHAIAKDPSVPSAIAPFIASVFGLSNLAQMRPAGLPAAFTPMSIALTYDGALTPAGQTNTGGLPPGLDGAGQTIGLLEFDGFEYSDVENWLKFAGLPSKLIKHLSAVSIDGGTGPSGCTQTENGCGTTEVMLDIEAAMGIAQGANIEVFDAPSGTDLASALNFAGNTLSDGGSGILSTSWYTCEADISSSDATSIDSMMSDLAVLGVTVFAATNDHGSTCVDGQGNSYPNDVAFPADAAHIIAVGGTSLFPTSDDTYGTESWWKNAGGYGVSQFIPEPSYQSKLYPSAGGRSLPDVSMEAAPGLIVCQASSSLSPDCGVGPHGELWLIQGTSLATPLWAGTWAIAQQAAADAGVSLSSPAFGLFYTVPKGFHAPSAMTGKGNNFAHVGLGSPNIAKLISELVPIQIDSFNPAGGIASGNTKVTITGTGFIDVKSVKFGGVSATHLHIDSDKQLTVEAPQAPSDQATIEIETAEGSASSATKFLYTPVITKISPNSGSMWGGQPVTITGYGLDTSEAFLFFGPPATKVECPSSTKCTMLTPANPPGTAWVEAQTDWGGDSTITTATHYFYDPLSITSISPLIGPTSGGEFVQINGHSFENGKTTFSFGGSNATGVFCPGPDYCYMNSPAHATAGAFPVTATVGTITSAPAKDKFTFEVFPTVTGISPGQAKAGSVVTLTGTGFSTSAGQTTFNFFGINVDGTCATSTQCAATVPFSSAHSTAVTVTVNGNTSLDWVDFSYPGKPAPPGCKPGTCN